MSWRHTKAAGELPLKRPPTKAVLLTLAHHADEYTGHCYPSIARICLFTGLSERSVQNGLTELESAGHIKRWIGRNRTVSVYQVTLEAAPVYSQGQERPTLTPHHMHPLPTPQDVHPRAQEIHPQGAGGAGEGTLKEHKKKDAPTKGPVPVDWWPNESAIKEAMKELPNVDITTETRQFIDYNTSHGNEFASIGAAWRAWLRRAKPGAGGRGPKRAAETGGLDRLRELASGGSA